MLFYFILAVIFLFVLIVQGSFFSFFFVGQALPDILLVIVIIMGFLLREKKGAITGLGGGLFQDLLFGHTLGFFALSKMLMGFGAGLVGKEIYRDNLFAPVIIVFIGTIIHELLMFALVYLFIGEVSFEWGMLRQFTGQAIYNSLLTILLYPLFFWLFRQRNFLGLKED